MHNGCCKVLEGVAEQLRVHSRVVWLILADSIDEKLISFVFQYEILYDIGHKYYHDTTRR